MTDRYLSILFAARSLPFHWIGGMETITWDLARELARSGHRVSVLTTPFAESEARQEIEDVTVYVTTGRSGHYSRDWWEQSARFLADHANEVDAVIGVSAAANSMVRVDLGAPRPVFAFQAHGTSWGEVISKLRQPEMRSRLGVTRNLYWGIVKDHIYRRYDVVVPVGEAVDRQLRTAPTKWLVGDTPVRLIPNGVDERVFGFNAAARQTLREELGIGMNDRVVVSVSRLHPQKGVAEGIDAFAKAARDATDLHFVIAGDGPQEHELRDKARRSPVSSRIHFMGRVERKDVPRLLSMADVFLFATQRVEGLPMNVLEALGSGLPVLASEGACDRALPCTFIPACDLQGFARAICAVTPGRRTSRLPKTYTLAESAAGYVRCIAELRARTR